MKLYEKDSVEDLKVRGYGPVVIARMLSLQPRDVASTVISDVDQIAYLGEHLRTRFAKDEIVEILDEWASLHIRFWDVTKRLGFGWRVLLPVFRECMSCAGYSEVLDQSETKHQCSIQSKIQQTSLDHWGCANASKSPIVQQRIKEAFMKKYDGVDNPSKVEAVKEKKRQTTRKHFGVDNPLSSSIVREKSKRTVKAVYGVENVSQAEEIKAKKVATEIAHYGQRAIFDPGVRAKVKKTMMERYGYADGDWEYPLELAQVRKKAADSQERKSGYRNPFDNPEVQASIREFWLSNYGVENPSQVAAVQQTRIQTMLSRWGVENPYQSEAVKAKIRQTCLRKYGCEHAVQSAAVQEKIYASLKRNHSFRPSPLEDRVYDRLLRVFDCKDIERQYKCDRYPFAVDFYIYSRDLFIEVNGHWAHGPHFFGTGTDDAVVVDEWFKRAVRNTTKDHESEYFLAIDCWTRRDPIKRRTAAKHKLNYVVFWGVSGVDIDLWFDLGCPDGSDWLSEYTWHVAGDVAERLGVLK